MATAAFKIEQGVPLPAAAPGRRAIFPFADMAVGDSFFVPADKLTIRRAQQRLSGAANWAAKHHGREFATRRVEGGVRVWRTA